MDINDVIFTMLMAEATNTDPFEMEGELEKKGLIKKQSIWKNKMEE